MSKIRPPTKMVGGKAYLCHWIIDQFPPHRVYAEPFGGGASVLLNKEPCPVETYNDLNGRLTRLFRVLRDKGKQFLAKVQLTPYSQAEFVAAQAYPKGGDDVAKAVCDFVRWRQSFGGQGQSWSYTTGRARGGMAGDVNGWWTAIAQLPRVIQRLSRVQIANQDALEFIPRFDHKDGLLYCDPPYAPSARAGNGELYEHALDEAGHRRLAALLQKCQAKVVLSGYPSPLYDELYRDWRCLRRDIA